MVKRKIGRAVVSLGEFNPNKIGGYDTTNRCSLYGCDWESKIEGNQYPPAALVNGRVVPDYEHWNLTAGNPDNYGLSDEVNRIDSAIGDDNSANTIKGRIKTIETAVGDGGSVDTRIESEKARAQGIEATKADKSNTYTKQEVVNIVSAEEARAQGIEATKADKSNTYTKQEVDDIASAYTSQKYETFEATAQTTATADLLPNPGTKDTIYRIAKWDGNVYNENAYTEYTWNGTAYIQMDVKNTGIDKEPTGGSNNLVESDGVFKKITLVGNKEKFVAGRINDAGAVEAGAGYVCAHLVALSSFTRPIILFNVSENLDYSVNGVTFYDASKTRLSNLSLPKGLSSVVVLDGSNIPNNAAYFSVTCAEAQDYGIGCVFVNDYIKNGFLYFGVAVPTTTPVNNPRAFYLATQIGDYSNFGVTINSEGLYVISGGNGTWKADCLSNDAAKTYFQKKSISQIGIINGKRILSDGTMANGSGYAVLYKYPVSMLKFPLMVCGVDDNHTYNIYGVTYYNAEGVLSQLSQKGDFVINKDDIPSGATAVSFSFATSKFFGISSLHSLDDYVPANKNLFIHKGKRINVDGNLESADGYVSAYKIPISRFSLPLYVYGVSQNTTYNVYGITCYNANGERIGFVDNQSYTVKDIVILTEDNLPGGTAYISVTSHNNLNGGIDGESINDIASDLRKESHGYWEGKSICVIGDSITANGGWEPKLKETMKLAHCYNRGISGSKLRNVAGPDNILLYTDRNDQDGSLVKQYISKDADIPSPIPSNCILLAKSETGMCNTKRLQYMVDNLLNVDAYIIWGGVNDWTMPSGVTTWSQVYNIIHNDSYDLTHIEDAYIKLIKHCRTINPQARVFCIGVPRAIGYIDDMQEVGGRPGADFLFAINGALEKVSSLLGVPFLNLLNISPITKENTNYYGDGLHPTTDLGYRTYAGEIASFLKQYMPLCQ